MALIIKGDEKLFSTTAKLEQIFLLRDEDTGDSRLQVTKEYIRKGYKFTVENSQSELCCLQVLSGEGYCESKKISNTDILFISHDHKTVFVAKADTVILKTTVKDFKRFEKLSNQPSKGIRVINWHDEPVLQSEHDARQRIYIATKNLWGTFAVKGEIIIYPPNTEAPPHFHVGAEHFQYVLSGEGLAVFEDRTVNLQAGDLVYNFENEIHSFKNKSNERFTFVEFFVPGDCETIWTTTEKICTWNPTNKNLKGYQPTRYIPKHIHGEKVDI
ncbi:MAG: cupin domain-containing protein [Pseudomonadota bacterium]|nr:cupin domain-containing protein [Pseudomonadota bacterium]